MRYYPTTTKVLRETLLRAYPGACARPGDADDLQDTRQTTEYLLWMLDQIQTFKGRGLVGKRGRWIGYVQATIEGMGLVSNTENRALTRQDVDDKKE